MRTLWITFTASLLASVLSARLADALLTTRIPLLGSFLGFELSRNQGIAFGIQLLGPLQFPLILAALAFVAWYAACHARAMLSQIGLGLILGGGLANVADRLLNGSVTDYFQVGSFPIFNVADSCITIGIVLLFYEMVVKEYWQ